MAKKMLIDATHAEETRVVVVDGNKVEEFDFESENKRQLAGNIYLAKVTRVEPSLQAAFVDYGGNRHGFLAFSEIHPDYYQIPVADREALLEEERAYAEAMEAREEERSRSRSSRKPKAEDSLPDDEVAHRDVEIGGMDVIDLDEGSEDPQEGLSPMETVEEAPVEEPTDDTSEDDSQDDDGDEDGDESSDDEASDEEGGSRSRRSRSPARTRRRSTRSPPSSPRTSTPPEQAPPPEVAEPIVFR
jgi:ribonuclease E